MDVLADRYLTRRQVAEMFGIAEKTLAQWASRKTGPKFYKLGGHARYKLSDCQSWADAQEVA